LDLDDDDGDFDGDLMFEETSAPLAEESGIVG